MLTEIKNEKNFLDWKIVIIQHITKERGGEKNSKTPQKFYFC
jgi:hypothetical protein